MESILTHVCSMELATVAVVVVWIAHTLVMAWRALARRTTTQLPHKLVRNPKDETTTTDSRGTVHEQEDDDAEPTWLQRAYLEAMRNRPQDDTRPIVLGQTFTIHHRINRAETNQYAAEEPHEEDREEEEEIFHHEEYYFQDAEGEDSDSDEDYDDEEDNSSTGSSSSSSSSASSSSSSSSEEDDDESDEESFGDTTDNSDDTSSSSSEDDQGIDKVKKAWAGMLSVASLIHNRHSVSFASSNASSQRLQPEEGGDPNDDDEVALPQLADDEQRQQPPRSLDLWSISLDYECVRYLVDQVKLLRPEQRLQAIDLYDIEIDPWLLANNNNNVGEDDDDEEDGDAAANNNHNHNPTVAVAETMGQFFKANADTLEDMEIGSSSSGTPLSADTIETWLSNLVGMERLHSLSFRSTHLTGVSLGDQLKVLLLSCPITTLIFKHCRLDHLVMNRLARGVAQMPNLAVLKFDHCTATTAAAVADVDEDNENATTFSHYRGVLVDALLETPHPCLETVSLEDQYLASLWQQRQPPQQPQPAERRLAEDEESLLAKLSRLLQTCPSLGRLDLTNNALLFSHCKPCDMDHFLSALRDHPSLTQLIMDGCGIDNVVATRVFQTLQHNHVLERLELWRNPMTLVPAAQTKTTTTANKKTPDEDWIACLPHLDTLQYLYMPREMLGDDGGPALTLAAAFTGAGGDGGGDAMERMHLGDEEKTASLDRLYHALARNLSLLRFCILWTNVPDPVEPYMARNRVYGQLQGSVASLRTRHVLWPRLLTTIGTGETPHGHEGTLVHAFVQDALASFVAESLQQNQQQE